MSCQAKSCTAPARFSLVVCIPVAEPGIKPIEVMLNIPLCTRHAKGANPQTFNKPRLTDTVDAVCTPFGKSPLYDRMSVRTIPLDHPRFLSFRARREEQTDTLAEGAIE